MQGGTARCRASRYSRKFFVLPMSLRMDSRVWVVRALTWDHVRLRRWMGAEPRAEMMEVRQEKLFRVRHLSAMETKCLMTTTRRFTSCCVNIICATQFVS